MATSGTHTFNLDISDIMEEAYDLCGLELRSGYSFRGAKRALNLVFLEWQNKGLNLWTVEQATIPLVQGTATYDLPTTTIDLISQVIRTGTGTTQSDITISRISNPTYASIPSKNDAGRPIQVYIDRQAAVPKITLWPIPNDGSYTFVYWFLKRIDDAGTGVNTQHIPFRFLPCMVAGLAYYLAMKNAPTLVQQNKLIYEDQLKRALDEDGQRASTFITPQSFYPNGI